MADGWYTTEIYCSGVTWRHDLVILEDVHVSGFCGFWWTEYYPQTCQVACQSFVSVNCRSEKGIEHRYLDPPGLQSSDSDHLCSLAKWCHHHLQADLVSIRGISLAGVGWLDWKEAIDFTFRCGEWVGYRGSSAWLGPDWTCSLGQRAYELEGWLGSVRYRTWAGLFISRAT